jgi:uracil-DNA glycosylase
MGQKINPLGFRLVQPKITIPFGSHNQKIILKVYRKIKKYGIVSRTIYKRIGKKARIEK